MTYGTIDFLGKIYEVKGESLNCYIQPARMFKIMRNIIDWVSNNNIIDYAQSSQIHLIEGQIIGCRIHDNLENLVKNIEFDIEYLDIELDPVLMIIHFRFQII